MEAKKEAICNALAAFIRQRPGLEYGNYGDRASYQAEVRSIGKDKQHAETLLAAVRWRDSITADLLMEAGKRAFSGRLTIESVAECQNCRWHGPLSKLHPIKRLTERVAPGEELPAGECPDCNALAHEVDGRIAIDYCTGQYFPTEYRKAVCAVLASALREYSNKYATPTPTGYRAQPWGHGEDDPLPRKDFATLKECEEYIATAGKQGSRGYVVDLIKGQTVGAWGRDHFRREFGSAIQRAYFN